MSAFAHRFKLEISSGVSLFFWVGLILFVAVTGPFGTYAAYSFGQRFIVAAPLLLVTMLLGIAVRTLVFGVLRPRSFRLACVLNGALASLIIAPAINEWLRYIPADTLTHPGLSELMLLVFSLSLGLSSLRRSVSPELYAAPQQPTAHAPEPPQAEPPPRLPRLLQRLEAEERGTLWAISVRDHYVDVQTSAGVASLLMRLSDAMAETDPVEGAQIHRSHWVAWQAIGTVERDGPKLFVQLPNGTRLPVSKNHRDKLTARGLL